MGNTTTLGNKSKFRELLDSFGLPRLIIACFLLLLLIAAPCVGLDFPTQITNIITRFSWNAVMVLAMVPMVHSGCGLNFGLPLGIVSGLLGATLSIELGYTGFASFLMAILIATPFALLFGGGYMSGTPLWYQLPAFALHIFPVGVMAGLLTLESGSVWPAAFLHAAHNNYDQAVFQVITAGANKMYFVSETGVLTILCAWALAVILYMRVKKQAQHL